ncbi:hypothetical protein [Desulfotruncus alcoholivorax]|uniref:hypothetical protein n=1 Tax=Desulfotruncus alcoholivorax TaxID=265477 RepID=UPI0004240FC8|nr:hypothetical protein [Desulfotruncus alcoholivorax]
MHEELNKIKLKMKALGFSQQQIESIIEQTLSGKDWEELNESEKQQVLQSIDERIVFVRKFLQIISCNYCCK